MATDRSRTCLTLISTLALVAAVGCDDDPVTPSDAGPGEGITDGLPPDGSIALQHGNLGRYSALAVHKGELLASAYEEKYGDLVLVSASTTDPTTLTKVVVDGVPAVAPTKTGWRGGVEPPGDDVGHDTDIVVTSSGQPMISYRDKTNNTLRLAVRSGGTWQRHVIDTATSGSKELLGRYSSLVLLGGKPALAYLVLNLADSTGKTFRSELRWAEAKTTAPSSKQDWTITVIDKGAMPCRNLCGSSEVCALKTDGSSACAAKGTGCAACATGEECVGGTCTPILADDKIADIPRARGLWPSAVVAAGSPVVIYYDRILGNLVGATRSGGAWQPKTIKGSSTDDVGAHCAAAADAAGTVHVAYQDVYKAALAYVQVDAASLGVKVTEIIDDGLRADGLHPVGADPAILIDGSGQPRVIYQDQQNADLLTAVRAGVDSWTPKSSTDANLGRLLKGGKPGYGFYSSLVLEGGKVFGSSFLLDAGASPKGSLELFEVK